MTVDASPHGFPHCLADDGIVFVHRSAVRMIRTIAFSVFVLDQVHVGPLPRDLTNDTKRLCFHVFPVHADMLSSPLFIPYPHPLLIYACRHAETQAREQAHPVPGLLGIVMDGWGPITSR